MRVERRVVREDSPGAGVGFDILGRICLVGVMA